MFLILVIIWCVVADILFNFGMDILFEDIYYLIGYLRGRKPTQGVSCFNRVFHNIDVVKSLNKAMSIISMAFSFSDVMNITYSIEWLGGNLTDRLHKVYITLHIYINGAYFGSFLNISLSKLLSFAETYSNDFNKFLDKLMDAIQSYYNDLDSQMHNLTEEQEALLAELKAQLKNVGGRKLPPKDYNYNKAGRYSQTLSSVFDNSLFYIIRDIKINLKNIRETLILISSRVWYPSDKKSYIHNSRSNGLKLSTIIKYLTSKVNFKPLVNFKFFYWAIRIYYQKKCEAYDSLPPKDELVKRVQAFKNTDKK